MEANRHIAIQALIQNGTRAAFKTLSDYVGEDLEGQIAVSLINNLEDNSNAIERTKNTIVRKIGEVPDFMLVDQMLFLTSNIKDQEDLFRVFSDQAIEEKLRVWSFMDDDGGLGTSKKTDWIKCLSVLDGNAALIAAKSAFLNTTTRNRDRYPSLLVYIDEHAAISFLLEAIKTDDEIIIQAAIGRALARSDITDILLRDLESTDSAVRLSACFMSRWQKPSSELEEKLRLRVSDMNELVSQEASFAIAALWNQREANLLGEAFLKTEVDSERWILLECILNLCDMGDNFNPWPLQGPAIGKELTSSQVDYCRETLKRKRKREVLN